MRNWTVVTTSALLLGFLPAIPADGAGSQPVSQPTPEHAPPQMPEEAGKEAYNLGLKHRDKAWSYEDKAKAATSDADRGKLLGKAQKQYEKAIPLFETATEKIPEFHQAFSSLGYALRKTHQHEKALAAYDRALEIAPFYVEAIEYRAEAYLGLGRLEDAKEAYMLMFSGHREHADQLMEAMKTWVEERRADPAGMSAADVDAFATWVKERGEIADQSARLSHAATRVW